MTKSTIVLGKIPSVGVDIRGGGHYYYVWIKLSSTMGQKRLRVCGKISCSLGQDLLHLGQTRQTRQSFLHYEGERKRVFGGGKIPCTPGRSIPPGTTLPTLEHIFSGTRMIQARAGAREVCHLHANSRTCRSTLSLPPTPTAAWPGW